MTATEVRHGQRLSARAWALIEDAAAEAGIAPGVAWVSQGGYKGVGGGASVSGSTHDQGDVFDLRVWNLRPQQVEPLVVALRRRNGCAWLRDAAHGWTSTGPHIHCVLRDSADGLSAGARWQVQQYDLGRNGLSNLGKDYHPRPTQHHWEPDMPLTDADIEKIAEAVWRRAVKVDGEQRRMGAMAVACFKAAKVQLPAGEADEAP